MAGHKNEHSRHAAQRTDSGRWHHIYAALDLGTHNCRLLIARPTRRGFRVVDAFSRIVRLGEAVERDGVLCEAAMKRAVEALRICAMKIERGGVDRARCVATEAARRAANGAAFVARVAAETGLQIETIGWEEEARLALQGCAPLLDRRRRHGLLFDIGGGSTELIWLRADGRQPELLDSISIPQGVVSLSERYGDDLNGAQDYRAVVDEVEAQLKPFCARHHIGDAVRRGDVQMLGASGTVTTLAGVHLDLPRYDRSVVDGTFLDFDAVERVSGRLRGMCREERAAHPCIGAERARLVVAGCAVLEAIMRRWSVGRLRVADRGVREGILLDLMRQAESELAAGA